MPDRTRPFASAAHSVIESIIELTEQREQHSLEQSLLGSLSEMLPGLEGWILDLGTGADIAQQFDVDGHPTHLPDAIMVAALTLRAESPPEIRDAAGRHYLLTPLAISDEKALRALILVREDWTVQEQRLVLGMIRVYQNFVRLLFDSERDTLTGLYNRRKLESKLSEVLASQLHRRRSDEPQHGDYLAVLDLDRFKRINDTFGHLIGDEVLLIFANVLRQTLRDSDLIFRYGGEEFVVILQTTPADVIQDVLERVRHKVESHAFPQVGSVTVSIGYAAIDGHQLPPEIIEEADRALYFAKENGRNQVCAYPQLVASGKIAAMQRHDGTIELF